MSFWWLVDRLQDQWDRRVAGFARWLAVAACLGGAAWFVILFGQNAYDDIVVSRHGVAVTATVLDTAPYDADTQYLLAFTIDGETDAVWEHDLPKLQVGETVAMLVDRRDHERMTSAGAYDRRWGLFIISAIAAVFFTVLACVFHERASSVWPGNVKVPSDLG